MKIAPTAVLLFALLVAQQECLAGGARASHTGNDEHSSESAVAALWATLDEQWNERNAQKFSDVFTENASLEFVDTGVHLESREAILQHFAKQFPTFPPDIHHRTSIAETRPVADDVRAADGIVRILRNADATPLRTYSIFAVMFNAPEGWRIHILRVYRLSAGKTPP